MIMKKFLFLICAALIFTACSNKIQSVPPLDDFLPKNAAQTQFFDTDIYFDATVSMKGFTTLPNNNVYVTLPDLLGDLCSANGQTNFFAFGEQIHALNGRNYRKFAAPDVYNEQITAIFNVIDRADVNKLSIIVTDLFENESDWSNVSKKIRDKFFAQNLSVGVIGIKNPFKGEIFDVGLNAAKFNYNSGDNPDRFRPFYLLILGQEDFVKNFLQNFNQKQNSANDTGFLLLSSNLNDISSDFSNFTLGDVDNFYSDDTLSLDNRFKEFGVDNFNENASFMFSWQYQPPLGVCLVDFSDVDTDINIFSAENDAWTPLTNKNNDVRVSLLKDERQADIFLIKTSLTPEKSLAEGKLNLVSIKISPKEQNFSLPAWIDLWNVDIDASAQKFDGSKTVNLSRILESLKNTIFTAAKPNLLQINFIVTP